MHKGIRGEVYIGGCPEKLDLKNDLKEFLAEEDFLVIDLGSFEINEQADCGVLAREVGEKVVEGVVFNQASYKENGLKVFGLLIDSKPEGLFEALSKFKDVVPAELFASKGKLVEANLLLLSGEEKANDIKEALRNYYVS